MEPLFLQGVFQEKIWGGTKLKTEFGYSIPSEQTGELWAISAHPNGPATVLNGSYKGRTLDDLWKNEKQLFGNQKGEVFPLLTKIIDAHDDLSVQVHPDDSYALKHEGELGKTECWYILSAEPGAKIIYGHHAQTKEELINQVEKENWENLLNYVEIQAGDFFYLPSGTIHALGKGIMILETQQSSDTTYRLYDYDRKDKDGNLRDLHIQESIDVADVPHINNPNDSQEQLNKDENLNTLVKSEFFTVYNWKIKNRHSFKQSGPYTLISVIDGDGTLIIDNQRYSINKGDHFILPHQIKEWDFYGDLHIIASTT